MKITSVVRTSRFLIITTPFIPLYTDRQTAGQLEHRTGRKQRVYSPTLTTGAKQLTITNI